MHSKNNTLSNMQKLSSTISLNAFPNYNIPSFGPLYPHLSFRTGILANMGGMGHLLVNHQAFISLQWSGYVSILPNKDHLSTQTITKRELLDL